MTLIPQSYISRVCVVRWVEGLKCGNLASLFVCGGVAMHYLHGGRLNIRVIENRPHEISLLLCPLDYWTQHLLLLKKCPLDTLGHRIRGYHLVPA